MGTKQGKMIVRVQNGKVELKGINSQELEIILSKLVRIKNATAESLRILDGLLSGMIGLHEINGVKISTYARSKESVLLKATVLSDANRWVHLHISQAQCRELRSTLRNALD